ncbi:MULTISPECIES: chaperone NapD [Halomonas]|uniref:Chaperone NapD n=1 Tax=Halomonas chromatireducens TaxID=507626 RepID=A0A125R083_9GAMM|nr:MULTISPECIES: chaperone NapD [Halomonas]AMD01416.1 assembly protein for periplasmic nitrate reductase [Halomonas chromatireducens]MBZ0332252.1 chaperone NapD [Halomonas sp. ANAO-440]
MPNDALHIASFLVHVQPEECKTVAQWLAAQPDSEIRAEDPSGKLVVVMESEREGRILDLIDAVQTRPGVLGAALVYHQMLEPGTADEPADSVEQQAPAEGMPT